MLRQILQDRFLAGAWALTLTCFLLLQAIMSGYGGGMMAASVSQSDIICVSGDEASASVHHGGHEQDHGKAVFDCCGTLCRLAVASVTAIVAAQFILIAWSQPGSAIEIPADRTISIPPIWRGLTGAPRAPPQLS